MPLDSAPYFLGMSLSPVTQWNFILKLCDSLVFSSLATDFIVNNVELQVCGAGPELHFRKLVCKDGWNESPRGSRSRNRDYLS